MWYHLLPRYLNYLNTGIDNAFLVGGAVRDLLCGRQPVDYDLVVAVAPHSIAARMAEMTHGRYFVLGKEKNCLHRVVHAEGTIDITLIKGGDISDDLGLRDFTINAMAIDLKKDRIVDPFAGARDVDAKIIRLVSPDGFDQDPLRMVRAFRLAACLNFHISAPTRDQITRKAERLKEVAGERIWAELQFTLGNATRTPHLIQMHRSGLLAVLFPKPRHGLAEADNGLALQMASRNTRHGLRVCGLLERLLAHSPELIPPDAIPFIRDLPVRECILMKLAILLHTSDNPCPFFSPAQNATPLVANHRPLSPNQALAVCRRLRMSVADQKWVANMLYHYADPLVLFQSPSQLSLGRFLRTCAFSAPHVLLLALAEAMAADQDTLLTKPELTEHIQILLRNYFTFSQPILDLPRLLDGNDIMSNFNLPPSPVIGMVLKKISEARLEGNLTNTRQALDWAKTYLRNQGQL